MLYILVVFLVEYQNELNLLMLIFQLLDYCYHILVVFLFAFVPFLFVHLSFHHLVYML